MFLAKKSFDNTPEFIKGACYQNVSCTVNDTGIEAGADGKKHVPGGTLLDKDGKAVKISRGGAAGSYTYTLSAAPVGILFQTIEVTYGPQPGALMIDGSVDAQRLQGEYVEEVVGQLVKMMPYVKFFVDGILQIKED